MDNLSYGQDAEAVALILFVGLVLLLGYGLACWIFDVDPNGESDKWS